MTKRSPPCSPRSLSRLQTSPTRDVPFWSCLLPSVKLKLERSPFQRQLLAREAADVWIHNSTLIGCRRTRIPPISGAARGDEYINVTLLDYGRVYVQTGRQLQEGQQKGNNVLQLRSLVPQPCSCLLWDPPGPCNTACLSPRFRERIVSGGGGARRHAEGTNRFSSVSPPWPD